MEIHVQKVSSTSSFNAQFKLSFSHLIYDFAEVSFDNADFSGESYLQLPVDAVPVNL